MTVIWMSWFIMSLASIWLSMLWFCSCVTSSSSISSKSRDVLSARRELFSASWRSKKAVLFTWPI